MIGRDKDEEFLNMEENGNEVQYDQVEKDFPNGDYYDGECTDNFTHGMGKYLWADGCMYVGDWCKGKPMGRGMFSWPSGAYEGQFTNDYIHGTGTTLRMGIAMKGNGDEGVAMDKGDINGKMGAFILGNGRMVLCGEKGFVWANGNSYDGLWEDGLPKGSGSKRSAWSIYNPSESTKEGHFDWDPQSLYDELNQHKICLGEKLLVLPSQKKPAVWKSTADRTAADTRAGEKGSNVGNEVGGDGNSATGSDLLEDDTIEDGQVQLQVLKVPRATKRPGKIISPGHKSYDLMLNLQLGIRQCVARPGPSTSLDLDPSAFDPNDKIWTRFPPQGSKHTPSHGCAEFKWKDCCPVVFRALRSSFKVDAAEYMLSICGDEALRELSSPGKSGNFFHLTNDDRYMIQTIKKAEVKVLLRMLPFVGLGPAQKKVRFIIMGNLFCTEYAIHRRFDLKGSSLGRITDKPEADINTNIIFKDLDLNFIFRLQKQVDKDCELLEQEGIMDYSLLVGIHFTNVSEDGDILPMTTGTPHISKADIDHLLSDPFRWEGARLVVSTPAGVERTVRTGKCESQLVGEPIGEFYEVVLFFGVIDILQDYDISKKLEHAYKSIQYDSTSISAVDPRLYSRRFRDFIFRIFSEDSG
ncbi:hypothetical protein K1719_007935 [Acacia pycnantha]|nr:hypothetical protein K1719_007935 [Acacia pycnantha]